MSRAYPIEQDAEYQDSFERVADAQDAAASGRGWHCPFCCEPLRDLERDFMVVPREYRWWNRDEGRLEVRAPGEMLDCAVCGDVICEKAEAERYFAAQRSEQHDFH